MKKFVFLLPFFLGILLPEQAIAVFHPKMGAFQALDPDSHGLMPLEDSYGTMLKPSQEYQDLLEGYRKAQRSFEESKDPKKKEHLARILESSRKMLIQLSLSDRQKYLVQHQKDSKEAADSNRFHPLNTFAAAEYSGALLWAHRQGILGEGSNVLILENVGYLAPPMADLIKTSDPFPTNTRAINWKNLAHAEAVTSVLYQMSPKAHIKLINSNEIDVFFDPEILSIAQSNGQVSPFPENPLIINWSGGAMEGSLNEFRIPNQKRFFEDRFARFPDLLVKAVPNSEGGFLSEKKELDIKFNEEVFSPYAAHIILVGNLDHQGEGELPVGPYNERQQSRFLCAQGENILTVPRKVDSGTSIAAPTISGAAALVQSKYPQFTPQQVGDILLESADRNFWLSRKNFRRGKVTDSLFIYDPETLSASPQELRRTLRLSEDVTLTPFDPKKLGRGLLSLRRAFLYAELKSSHPHLSIEDLRSLFKAAVKKQEEEAVTKIQGAYKKYKAKALFLKA